MSEVECRFCHWGASWYKSAPIKWKHTDMVLSTSGNSSSAHYELTGDVWGQPLFRHEELLAPWKFEILKFNEL